MSLEIQSETKLSEFNLSSFFIRNIIGFCCRLHVNEAALEHVGNCFFFFFFCLLASASDSSSTVGKLSGPS